MRNLSRLAPIARLARYSWVTSQAAGLFLATAEEAEQQQGAADLLLAAAEEAALSLSLSLSLHLLLATAEEAVEYETMLRDCHDAELAQKLAQTLIGALLCCY